jgi:hypothetical protein
MNRRQFLESAVSTSALTASPLAALAAAQPAARDVQTVWDKPEFAVRGLEIHSRRMWEWKSISSAFALMEQLNLNTLIFHQDDIQDAVVWPDKYFPADVRAARRAIQGAHDRAVFLATARQYLRNVASEAKKRRIKFFFEVCEIWYPEGLTELHPEIIGAKGTICPTDPFWWEFLRTKYTELFQIIPDLDGVIVSPGTMESKISIAMHTCLCESCSSTTPLDWYTNLIRSMYEPIHSQGKTLVVRDFAYTKADQDLVMNACNRVSPNIVAALKNTPHDFYPTFPNNPRIGHVGSSPQWIEFDCWGQFYGCGLFPCSVIEDMQRRLTYARANGATGAWFRTDLESMTDQSVFNCFNLLNLVAGAMLSQRTAQNIDDPYRAWLKIGLFDPLVPESLEPAPVPIPSAHLARLRDFMRASWAVMEKTYYVRGFVFNVNGLFFDSVDNAFFLATVHHGREDWEPGANKRVEPTEENIAAIVAEKDAALAEVQKLPGMLNAASLPLPAEFKAHLETVLSFYREYVRGTRLCAIGCFRAKQATLTRRPEHARLALQAADELQQYRTATANLLDDKFFPHYVHRAFDLGRLDSLIQDIRNICLPLSKAA